MYPTASGFLAGVAKHGMLIGIMMTTDRLLHEWDEQERAPRIVKYGIQRTYDPVEANDFWWTRDTKARSSVEVSGSAFCGFCGACAEPPQHARRLISTRFTSLHIYSSAATVIRVCSNRCLPPGSIIAPSVSSNALFFKQDTC
jgi:hypothetical protein